MQTSVADPNHFDPDPAFHFDMNLDPDPFFHFDTDPNPTVWYRSGSLPFLKGNVPKTVLFVHLNLSFIVSRFARTQPKGIFC
jgi:hypothetical protein